MLHRSEIFFICKDKDQKYIQLPNITEIRIMLEYYPNIQLGSILTLPLKLECEGLKHPTCQGDDEIDNDPTL